MPVRYHEGGLDLFCHDIACSHLPRRYSRRSADALHQTVLCTAVRQ